MLAVYFGGVRVMADETGIYTVALAVVIVAMTLAALPSKPRQIVTALLVAVLGTGVGVALAVPYHCDPVWKYLGWC